MIRADDCGTEKFHIDIEDRRKCMKELFNNGEYVVQSVDSPTVSNMVKVYQSISAYWDDKISDDNIDHFVYWLCKRVKFSKVWTSDDDLAYVIFETMNDRGLSLTPVEMLRSYLLANISTGRTQSLTLFDESVTMLRSIGPKIDMEFFKVYFKACLAEDLSNNKKSDFIKINNGFHRWVRDSEKRLLGLNASDDFEEFIKKIAYYSRVYKAIQDIIDTDNVSEYPYVIINHDYGFTMQYPFILSSINYNDDQETIQKKIKMVSKYLTIVLSSKVWKQKVIAQSYLEDKLYQSCKAMRGKSISELNEYLLCDPMQSTFFDGAPILNQQNHYKIKVLLSYITFIVGRESGEFEYPKPNKNLHIEHIWADHYSQHSDECSNEEIFKLNRNTIGDLLVLPSSPNQSYQDDPYEKKVVHYYEQNILAKTLCKEKYENNPGFLKFKESSNLDFKPYEHFTINSITERTALYRSILKYDLKKGYL